MRFEFAAPSFIDENATQYQTRLDGLDDDWSEWTGEARRDYTNLGFGDFRFRVRARNVAGQMSDEGDVRVHDPAAVVSHVVGVCRGRRAAPDSRRSVSTASSAAG